MYRGHDGGSTCHLGIYRFQDIMIMLHVFVADLCPCHMSTLINAHVTGHFIFQVNVVVKFIYLFIFNLFISWSNLGNACLALSSLKILPSGHGSATWC